MLRGLYDIIKTFIYALLATGGAENDLATAAQPNGFAQRAVSRDRFVLITGVYFARYSVRANLPDKGRSRTNHLPVIVEFVGARWDGIAPRQLELHVRAA